MTLLAWGLAKLVGMGEMVSLHGNQVVDLSKRIEKLETAALLSATVPGKLDTIAERVLNLVDGQKRIERHLGDDQTKNAS